VDINHHGVHNAERLALARGVVDRVNFLAVDATQPLPFPAATFDAVVSNDAMCHLANRLEVLCDWHRVLRPQGRILFTDAMVVTGLVSHEEIAVRSSVGFYLFVPPGENERLIVEAGFTLVSSEDVTASAAAIAQRWHDAREQHRAALIEREGDANFAGLQRFLACVQRLSAEHRLSRFCYVAEKAA
jgi:SAM-dependent methyltransferase